MTHFVSGLEIFHYIEKRQASYSACKHGASQKDIYGPCVVMVVAQKVGGAHKNILYQTTELSYLVEQNIKILHTEKERYIHTRLATYTTYVCYIVLLAQNSIVCLLLPYLRLG